MSKFLCRALLLVGVLLILAGLLLTLVIVPGMKMFPDDVDTMRHYNVEYLTLLDADTLQFYRAEPSENPNLVIDRHVKVEAVDGEKTLVLEEQTLYDGDMVLVKQVKHYPLNRRTMEVIDEFPDAWAQTEGYWQRQGLVIGWGIGTKQQDYIGWSDDQRLPINLVYQEEQTYHGLDTYYFTSQSEPRPIDPAHIAVLGLPEAISITSLATLASSIDSPDIELTLPQRVLLIGLITEAVEATQPPQEGELMVPLVYLYNFNGEYWVEPTTGVLIDTHKTEHRAATFPQEVMDYFKEKASQREPDSPEYLPPDTLEKLMPITVNAFAYHGTEGSVQDAIDDAIEARDRLHLFGTTIPLMLIALGVLFEVGGFFGLRRL